MNRLSSLVFKANCSSGRFRLISLSTAVNNYADIKNIKYYSKANEDYAIVHVKKWKDTEKTKLIVDELCYNHMSIVSNELSDNNKKWVFTSMQDPGKITIVNEEPYKINFQYELVVTTIIQ